MTALENVDTTDRDAPSKERAPVTIPEADQALNAALAAAQGEFPTIPKNQTAEAGSYSYGYADLATILAAVRPALAAHGLSVVQRLEAPGGTPSLRTEIRHAGGGIIAASFPLPTVPQNAQQLGSLLTYLRRYALAAMLAVAPEEDDDGQQAAPYSYDAELGDPDEPQEATTFQAPPLRADQGGADALSDAQRRKIYALRGKLLKAEVISEEDWQLVMSAEFGTETVAELTKHQASTLIERLVRKEEELGADT